MQVYDVPGREELVELVKVAESQLSDSEVLDSLLSLETQSIRDASEPVLWSYLNELNAKILFFVDKQRWGKNKLGFLPNY